MNWTKRIPIMLAGIAFLLLFWECAARAFGSSLLLPGIMPTLKWFIDLLLTRRFYTAVWGSFLRVLAGIALAVPLGIISGIVAGLDKRALAFLRPLFSVISATPVISVILIAFLILGDTRTPVFTAFLMIFPVISANVIEGINSTDAKLRELFVSFRMSRKESIHYLYIPTLAPFILGALNSSLSLCWKVVVAAEVIVQPARSLGLGMQRARAMLETPELFAWTGATIIAAALSQGLLLLIARLCKRAGP